MHLIRVLLTVAWITLAAMPAAHAEPITLALLGSAFVAANPLIAAVVTIAISSAVSFAANYVIGLFAKADDPAAPKQPGFELQIKIGDDTPVSFPAGFSGISGSRKYIGTWGKDGDTPNAYLTDVIQVSDRPSQNLNKFWAMKKPATILWGEAPAEQGYPVLEYRVDGKDFMWVQWINGSQTTALPFLMAKFGAKPWRPWTNEFIGWGCAYAVVTTLVNHDLFQGAPDFLFEPSSSRFYDLRKDSTNGGSGTHRWDDQNTWEPSSNPVVIIYNVIRGIYYGSEWIYGGQNLPAFRLPPSSWMAAANECDVQVPLAAGGTQNQYRCGTEIRGDIEPLTLIQTLLTGCAGRIAEVGGRFEILVGAPGSAVFSFTDDDIAITKGQSLTPFPSLQNTHNGIEATFPSSSDMWRSKDAPPRYSPEFEAADGRLLLTSVSFPTVPFGIQVQRLMKLMLEEERRFRVHVLTLGPEAWALTPNTVVSWTSARNGYTNKKFLIVRKTGERGFNQVLVLKEIDPSDYGWSSDDEIDEIGGSNEPEVIPPQEVKGFRVEPAKITGANGTERPAIDVFWDGTQPDVRTIQIRIRRAEGDVPVFQGRPVDFAAGVARIGDGLLSLTDYEVQVEYEPFSDRPTELSDWLPVTTPDARLSFADIDASFRDVIGILTGDGTGSLADGLRELRKKISQLAATTIDDAVESHRQRVEMVAQTRDVRAYFLNEVAVQASETEALVTQYTELSATVGTNTAGIIAANIARADGDSALANSINLVSAEVDDNAAAIASVANAFADGDEALAELIDEVAIEVDGVSASGLFSMKAVGAPSGVTVRLAILARKNTSTSFTETGFVVDIFSDNSTRIAIKADELYVLNASGTGPTLPFKIVGGVIYIQEARIEKLSLGTTLLENGAISRVVQSGKGGSVNPTPGAGAFLQGASISVPASTNGNQNVAMLIDFVAGMTRPTTSSGNFGSFQLVLLRAGSEIDRSPEYFYDDNFIVPPKFMFGDVDLSGISGSVFYSVRGVITSHNGGYDFDLTDSTVRLQLAMR